MAREICLYLACGKAGRATTVCRLDDPPEDLAMEIGRLAYETLLEEARELAEEEPMLAELKRTHACILRGSLTSLFPGMVFEVSPSTKEGAEGKPEG